MKSIQKYFNIIWMRRFGVAILMWRKGNCFGNEFDYSGRASGQRKEHYGGDDCGRTREKGEI